MQSLIKYIISSILVGLTISGCSGGGSCNNCSSPTLSLSLSLTAPNQFPAGVPATAYLTISNTSSVDAINLFYTIPDATNYTGTIITVANDSSNPCLNINAGASCTFAVSITNTPASHPGSFTIIATPGAGSGSLASTVSSRLGIQAASLSLTANIGLTNLPVNNAVGASGVNFLYAQTIEQAVGQPTKIAIVAVVNSASTGIFNTINLTDESGNLLNFEVLSNNSGSNMQNLGQNDIVSFLLTIPAGLNSYQFYAQTAESGTVVSQGQILYPISLTAPGIGILTVQPSNFSLSDTSSYESQLVLFTNTGSGMVNNLVIPNLISIPVTMTNNCGDSLAPGASCSVALNLHAAYNENGTGSLVAYYSNYSQSASSTFSYAGPGPRYIFITANGYTGNLQNGGGVLPISADSGLAGADAICQSEAYAAGSVIPADLTFKAMIISATRSPCDDSGACGLGASSDWPVISDWEYITPGVNGVILSSESNEIFESTYTQNLIRNASGNIQGNYFWIGAGGVRTGSVASQLTGWTNNNLSAVWTGGSWTYYIPQNCSDWTTDDGSNFASYGDNGALADNIYTTAPLNLNAGYSLYAAYAAKGGSTSLSRWITQGSQQCNSQNRIMCIQVKK